MSRIGLNLHVTPSNLCYQSRLDRVTSFLKAHGPFSNVEIAGHLAPDLPAIETEDDGRVLKRFRVYKTLREASRFGRALDFVVWYVRVLSHYLFRPVSCVNAHTVSVLPLCWLLSVLKGCLLVYEPHELETETHMMKGVSKRLAQLCERTFIGRAASVITVNGGIAEWYRRTYHLTNVSVIRNLPRNAAAAPLSKDYFHSQFGIPETAIVFLYQGLIVKGRGIVPLLAAFEKLPVDRHIVFLGFGALVDQVKEYEHRLPNVHYHPPVPSSELLRYSACADVGILLNMNTSRNNYYSYPNKYTEYLTAGIPVMFSDFLWLREEAEHYDCGWATPPDVDGLMKVAMRIDETAVKAKRYGARNWARDNNWSREEQTLNDIYTKLFVAWPHSTVRAAETAQG